LSAAEQKRGIAVRPFAVEFERRSLRLLDVKPPVKSAIENQHERDVANQQKSDPSEGEMAHCRQRRRQE
jgi:hypothetical protein